LSADICPKNLKNEKNSTACTTLYSICKKEALVKNEMLSSEMRVEKEMKAEHRELSKTCLKTASKASVKRQ
jgi:hypothetical protein